MKTKHILTGIACLVLGLVAGVLIERERQGSNASEAPPSAASLVRGSPINAGTVAAEFAKLIQETNATQRSLSPLFPGQGPFDDFHGRSAEFAARLTPDAFPSAAQAALSLTGARQTHLLSSIMARWSSVDLEAARNFALQQSGPSRKVALQILFQHWNTRAPETLESWVGQASDRAAVEIALPVLVQRLSASDPSRAFTYWERMSPSDRRSWSTLVFRAWAEKDPAAAVTNLLQFTTTDYERQNLLTSALQAWGNRDAATAAAWLRDMPESTRRRELVRALAPALGRNAPQAGISLLQSLPAGDDRVQSLKQLVEAWATQDTLAAFRWAKELPEGGDRQAALEATLEKLGQINPAVLKEFILREPAIPAVANRAAYLARQLAGTNAAAVLDWARALPPGTTRDRILSEGLEGLDGLQPTNALAVAGELLAGETRRQAMRSIFNRWADRDPVAAAAVAAALPAGLDRGEMLSAVATRWTTHAPATASDWVLTLEAGADRRKAERAVATAMGQERPADAAVFVARLTPNEHSGTLLDTALRRWAAQDLEAAAAWLQSQPDDLRRRYGYRALAQVVLRTDLKRAAEFAAKSPPDDSYDSVREQIATRWAETDPQAAAKWLLANPPGESRLSYAFHSVFTKWAHQSPTEALAAILALPKDAAVFNRSQTVADYQRIALTEWGRTNPEAAMNWLSTNTTAETRTTLYSSILRQWGDKDTQGVLAWLKAQPSGDWRDKCAASALLGLAYERPEQAAQNVGLIADEKRRQSTMESIANSWMRHDVAGASAWLQTNALPDTAKERIRKRKL